MASEIQSQHELAAGLFVDYENLFEGLCSQPHNLLAEDASLAALALLNDLRRRLIDKGYTLIVERSYADWEQMPSSAQRQLQITGLLPRFVDSREGRSRTDIEISLDVQEQMLTRCELKAFILVGGDRDYLPVLRRVKELNRQIVICSFTACLSGDIRDFASNYRHARIINLDAFCPPGSSTAKTAKFKRRQVVRGTTGARLEVGSSLGSLLPSEPDEVILRSPSPGPDSEPELVELADPSLDNQWEKHYLRAMMRFLQDNAYSEIHLGPFFRWLRDQPEMGLVSAREQREIFERLRRMGVILIEEREAGSGYTWALARLDLEHPLVLELQNG